MQTLEHQGADLIVSGNIQASASTVWYPWNGEIAMPFSYSKELTPTEIDKLYRDTYIS